MNNLRGFRQKKEPTKGQLAATFNDKIKGLSDAIQQMFQIMQRTNAQIAQKLTELSAQSEATDYRSLALAKVLEGRGILSMDELAHRADELRINDFEEQSKKDDVARGLIPVSGAAKIGQTVTFQLTTFNLVTGEKVDRLSMLRSKIAIGSATLPKILEDALLGVEVGQKKTLEVELPAEFGEYAGMRVRFEILAFDLKIEKSKAIEATGQAIEEKPLEKTEG